MLCVLKRKERKHSPCYDEIFTYLDLYNMGLNARKPVFGVCEQKRCRPASAVAQTDQPLCYSIFATYDI